MELIAVMVLALAACGDVLPQPVPPEPVPADAGPCVVGDVPGPLFVGPLKTGKRPCWQTSAGIVCPSEPPTNGAVPVGYFATLDGWQMIDDHAAQWNAIASNVQECAR